MSNILRPKCRFHRKRVAAILCFDLTDEHTQQKIGAFECSPNCDEYRKYSKGLGNNNLKGAGGGGAGKWVKYGPKLSHTPLSLSKNINFNPPHIMIILSLNLPPPPPLKKLPPPRAPVPLIPSDHTLNHWTLSLCRLCMNWEIPYLLQHRPLVLRFPRACENLGIPVCLSFFSFSFFLVKLNLR